MKTANRLSMLDDNNLKVGEKFKLNEIDGYYYFSDDGYLHCISSLNVDFISTMLDSVLNGKYKIKKLSPIPTERFIPKKGERYYFVTAGGNISYTVNYDVYLISHNLVFKTKEQVEDYKWFLDKVDEYKKPFKYYDDNYFLYYDNVFEDVLSDSTDSCIYQNTIYFGYDNKNIDAFIREVGEERIKKYMFDIWE